MINNLINEINVLLDNQAYTLINKYGSEYVKAEITKVDISNTLEGYAFYQYYADISDNSVALTPPIYIKNNGEYGEDHKKQLYKFNIKPKYLKAFLLKTEDDINIIKKHYSISNGYLHISDNELITLILRFSEFFKITFYEKVINDYCATVIELNSITKKKD